MTVDKIYFEIAGISIEVVSDLPILPTTFGKRFESFRINRPGNDRVTLHHHFSLPDRLPFKLSKEVYRKRPWAIFKEEGKWIYGEIVSRKGNDSYNRWAVFNNDYSRSDFYHDETTQSHYLEGGLTSLTLLPTDQILFSQILPARKGCYLHSAGAIIDGKGYIFAGHSGAGKSTITQMLHHNAEILCDDRTIIRKWNDDYFVHGTWSHGDVPDVSSASARLEGILFLHQADENRIVPVPNRAEALKRVLSCLIKPFVTASWWDDVLNLVEDMVKQVACFDLYFDKSGKIGELIEKLADKR